MKIVKILILINLIVTITGAGQKTIEYIDKIPKEYMNSDIKKSKRSFLYIINGKWEAITVNENDSTSKNIVENSKKWFDKIIKKENNPYYNNKLKIFKKYYAGINKTSRDKIITEVKELKSNKIFTVIETKHEFIINISSFVIEKQNKEMLTKMKLSKLEFINKVILDEIQKNIIYNINKKDYDPFVTVDTIYSLFYPHAIMNDIPDWKDRIELFWYKNNTYLCFYKFERGSATGGFTGVHWFNNEIRKRNNLPQIENNNINIFKKTE